MSEDITVREQAWEIFLRDFKDHDDVLLEDEMGDLYWGKMFLPHWGVHLVRPNGKYAEFDWHEIVFICHDGFPVREIKKMRRDEAIKRAGQIADDVVRSKLEKLASESPQYNRFNLKNKPRATDYEKVLERLHTRVTFGGGCPFVFENVAVRALHFAGNNGPAFWGEDDEETLVLVSRDNAVMHSFDLSHLFLFDGLTI